jgi:two-component system sensor histidine kinase BaeS
MIVVLFISLVLSFGISIIAALHFSRRVSRPADHLARSLSKMTSGDLSSPIVPEGSDELIQIAQSIERLRVNLIGEQTVRSQWSQDIAHDLRTPVASVKAQLEGMIDGVLQPDVPRFERTMRELERMEVLIQDLEMLMRLESPETEVHYEKIPVVHFLRDLSDQFDAQLQRKSMKLVTHSSVEFLVGDAVLLSRAVANLIHNAIRYGNEETEITVSVHQQGNGIQTRVHNVGNPIPLQDISKLTERMYRGEYARSTPGSGLGLTIVDRIVKLHGGLLSIVSSEDDGTCFSFIIPTSSTH